jgi:hypothetical protein
MPSKGDAANGIKAGAVIEQNRKSPHTKYGVIYFNLGDDFISIKFSQVDQL